MAIFSLAYTYKSRLPTSHSYQFLWYAYSDEKSNRFCSFLWKNVDFSFFKKWSVNADSSLTSCLLCSPGGDGAVKVIQCQLCHIFTGALYESHTNTCSSDISQGFESCLQTFWEASPYEASSFLFFLSSFSEFSGSLAFCFLTHVRPHVILYDSWLILKCVLGRVQETKAGRHKQVLPSCRTLLSDNIPFSFCFSLPSDNWCCFFKKI